MRRVATCLLSASFLALFVYRVMPQPPDRPGSPSARGYPGLPPSPLMMTLDADGNGEISAAELARAPEALRQLDANKDGKVTRDEILARPGRRGQPNRSGPGQGNARRDMRGQRPVRLGLRRRGAPRAEAAEIVPLIHELNERRSKMIVPKDDPHRPRSQIDPTTTYPIVDTDQLLCYDNDSVIEPPKPGHPFFGQDAQYQGYQPLYRDNGDGTVTDLVTGLMWQKDPGPKKTFREAVAGAATCRLAGYDDWRLPSIKELYSLILFSGFDPDPQGRDTRLLVPFINHKVFGFRYGDVERGERIIDAQFVSRTKYVSTTMHGVETVFGVNFADGRIKGYPVISPRGEKKFFVLYVRGNPDYGKNRFRDNGDGTVTDEATGLMWTKADSGKGMTWQEALAYAENLELAGYTDWRLPNAKELQSIVDYSRSPDTTRSAAIDPIFDATPINSEGGGMDFGYYWTSTTHRQVHRARNAVYIAFGRALGFMPDRRGGYHLLDVHGAGAQRSDPKAGDASWFPHGRGPQGDVIRIRNLVRCVRGGHVKLARVNRKR